MAEHETGELLEDLRQASLAQFDKVIKEAWRRINAVDDAHSTMVVPKLLAEISTAEREKAKLEGTVAPIRNEVSGPMGGRIEVSVDQRTALMGRITGLIVHSAESEDHSILIPERSGDSSDGLALLGEAEATST